MKNLTLLIKLSIWIVVSCIYPAAFSEDIKSDSSDFSIRILEKAAVIISPEKTTLPIFFSPEGNPAISIPANFPYRVLIQQNPNQKDIITSISIMNPQTRLIDLITVDRTQKAAFAAKNVVDEMRELSAKQQ